VVDGPAFEPWYSQNFFSSLKHPDRLCGPSSLPFDEYRGSFPGVKQPGREVDARLPYNA